MPGVGCGKGRKNVGGEAAGSCGEWPLGIQMQLLRIEASSSILTALDHAATFGECDDANDQASSKRKRGATRRQSIAAAEA